MATNQHRAPAFPPAQVGSPISGSVAAPGTQRTTPHPRSPLPQGLSSTAQTTPPPPGRQPKLLDRLREALRARHHSPRTEQTYCHWVKRYIFFHNVRHPAEMAEPEINAFLTHLAVKEKVSASTQTQALCVLNSNFEDHDFKRYLVLHVGTSPAEREVDAAVRKHVLGPQAV